MRSLQVVHEPPYRLHGDNRVLPYFSALMGSRFDYIDYEVPRNDREREYIEHVVCCRLVPGGIMNEVDPPKEGTKETATVGK